MYAVRSRVTHDAERDCQPVLRALSATFERTQMMDDSHLRFRRGSIVVVVTGHFRLVAAPHASESLQLAEVCRFQLFHFSNLMTSAIAMPSAIMDVKNTTLNAIVCLVDQSRGLVTRLPPFVDLRFDARVERRQFCLQCLEHDYLRLQLFINQVRDLFEGVTLVVV